MTVTEPQVIIIDDDENVRDALVFLMKSVDQSASAFSSAKEFIGQYSGDLPGCIVSDMRMPGMSGLELQQELRRRESNTPIIFISGHGDIPMAVEAIKAGAEEFLTKPFRDQALLDAINGAISRDQKQRSQLGAQASIDRCIDSLTRRERQVLDLVVAGKTNKAMADELCLSQRTIEVHRSHMMEKMGAHSLTELLKQVPAGTDSSS
ncbi:MAG: two-component system response regulator FixJ [Halioglobus sp.]|jgi:two-component system response regulator FixJ